MSSENLSRQEVRNIYTSEQKVSRYRSLSAEFLAHDWYKTTIPLKKLLKNNFQIYAGFNLNFKDAAEEAIEKGESGHLMRELYIDGKQDSRISWMVDTFLRLKDYRANIQKIFPERINSNDWLQQSMNQINNDLARVSIDHPEKPLILLNGTHGILPVPTGATIDGTRRTLALALALYEGRIQDDAPVNVIVGDINPPLCYAYNFITANLTNDEFAKDLLQERNSSDKYDLLSHID